jgi:hypothetical protein
MTPNLAFLASWREQIPVFMCYGQPEKFAQGAEPFNYSNTKDTKKELTLQSFVLFASFVVNTSRVPHSEHVNGRRS